MASSPSARRRERNSPARLRFRVLIGLLAVLALLVGLNAFALDRETGKASLTIPGASLVETTSGPLQVLDTGPPAAGRTALPLVLIHGSAGAIDWWDELIPLLKENRRVIALDLLGYGGSSKPTSGYSIESQAGLVAQVLNRLDVPKAIAVGHSLGGSVATALAESSPDLVAGVVLIDSSPDRATGGLDLSAKAAIAPVIGPLIWRLAPDWLLRKSLAQAFAPGTPVADRYVKDLRAMTYPAFRESADAVDRYAADAPLSDRLDKSGLPLLVIFGEQDQIYPAREALSAYAGVPGVKTVLIPGSGHSPQIEDPDQTASEIDAFAGRIDHRAALAAHQRRVTELRAARLKAAKARKAAQSRRAKAKSKAKRSKARAKSSKAGKKSPANRSNPGG